MEMVENYSTTANAAPMYAIFDLDGTLLDGDCTREWLRLRLQKSLWRLMLALPVLPLALLLLRFPNLRRFGASALFWIATVGTDNASLLTSFDEFVKHFHDRRTCLCWFGDAIRQLEAHLVNGEQVVVVTATPQWLVERLLRPWPEVRVIGSSLKSMLGGWIAGRHCRNVQKCYMLSEQGFGNAWAYAYSDSADDAPMLAAAEQASLINASARTVRLAIASGVKNPQVLHWR
jgi:phosphatidylglycerophosphatase C